jgi:hypothetical protein
MRTVILYHPKDEFAGMAQDYARDYHNRRQDRPEIELLSLDTAAGSDMAKLYDVVRYPAILAVADGGGLQKLWQDLPFPLFDEVSAYSMPGR